MASLFDRDALLPAAAIAADRLRDDPATAPIAALLAAWVEAGATRAALTALVPPAPRGGDHGRSDLLARAIPWLRKIRRQHYSGMSNQEAARRIRAALIEYGACEYQKNLRSGMFPGAEPHAFFHWVIYRNALSRGGDIIDAGTIARHLSGTENSGQLNFNCALNLK